MATSNDDKGEPQNEIVWQAKFITSTSTSASTEQLRPLRFRTTFECRDGATSKHASAQLYITSHGVYEAWINGNRVGDHVLAPGWSSYKHRLHYQTFDVTSLCHTGSNVLAIEVAEGWYAGRLGWGEGRTRVYGNELAAFAQLEFLDSAANVVERIVTDETWKWAYSAIVSSGIYDGETYDMRQQDRNWLGGADNHVEGWETVRKAAIQDARVLVKPRAPPARIVETIKPMEIIEKGKGKVIIDFGQNMTGKVRLHKILKPAGHSIKIRHAEVLEQGDLCLRPLRTAKATDILISDGTELKEWSPKYTFHGFRYVSVEGWSTTEEEAPLTKDSISALVIHTDMKRTGEFHCSNDLVNQLHDNATWSMRGNFLSLPTDCPQRDERLGWTGDIQVFAPSANFLYDTSGILSDWLQDLAYDQSDNNGVVPCVIPDVLQGTPFSYEAQAVWDDAAVLVPWSLYQSYGHVDVLKRQYESMKMHLDKAIIRGSDGLWREDIWQLSDWLDPSAPPQEPGLARTDGVLVADAYLVHITGIASRIAGILSASADAKRYKDSHAVLLSRFQEKYISAIGRIVSDTQTAIALVLCFRLYRNSSQAKVAADRLAVLVRQLKFRVSTGFAGTPLILHALSSYGHANIAYRMLLETQCPSWLYPVKMGATTIWERWDSMLPDGSINPGQMTSFNHYALGAVANWLHSVVGGISPLEPGWKRILVRPVPGGTIRSAEVKYKSAYGEISCEWKMIKEKTFQLKLQVPIGATALVVLPEAGQSSLLDEGQLRDSGRWVGNGSHEFTCDCDAYDHWPPPPLLTEWRKDTEDSNTYA